MSAKLPQRLFQAVEHGDLESVTRLVVEPGARLDRLSAHLGDKLSCLHIAARDGNVAIAEVLLAHGAKVNQLTGINGKTALFVAAMVRLLHLWSFSLCHQELASNNSPARMGAPRWQSC